MKVDSKNSGRADFIVAWSLYVAARALRAEPRPPWSGIADMEQLLESEYEDYATIFQYQDDLELAIRLGYPGEEVISLTRDDLRRWIETKQSAMTNVIDLCDWRSPNDEDGHTE